MNILITGGTGFLGRSLVKRLYDGNNLTIVARNEGNLIKLKEQYPKINIITGSIENEQIVSKACKDQEELYHLAAYKHVGLAETNTLQCTLSNIIGTLNLIEYFKGSLFVSISTDKTAKMQGVYGASKYIVEKLIKEKSLVNKDTRYVVPRYGNVIGSTGSIIPRWIEAAKKHQNITITDPLATRFFFTVDDAISLIFEAIHSGINGEPYIKEMKSCDIDTVASAIIEKYGYINNIDYIGLQEGENKHEWLSDDYTSEFAEKFTVEEFIKMI